MLLLGVEEGRRAPPLLHFEVPEIVPEPTYGGRPEIGQALIDASSMTQLDTT